MNKSLRGEVTAGVLWLGVQSVAAKVIGFASQLILARYLLPEAFGLMGICLIIITGANVVAGIAIDLVLQKRSKHIDLWLSHSLVIVSAGSIIATLAVAITALYLYLHHSVPLAIMLALYLFSVPATVFAMIPQVALQRDFRFKFLSIYNLFEVVLLQSLTILLVFEDFGAFSFAISGSVSAAVRAVVFWYVAPVSRRTPFRRFGLFRLTKAGFAAMGTRIATSAIEQGDYVVLSLVGDLREVGLYFFAFRTASQYMRTFLLNLVSVLLPALARLSNNAEKQTDAALRTSETVMYVIMPICFLQAAVAEPFLSFLFGSRWTGAAIYIEILSIGLAFDAMAWPAGALLTAQGRYRLSLVLSIIYASAFYLMIGSSGFAYGPRGVAVAVSAYYILHGLTMVLVVFDVRSVGWARMTSTFALPIVYSGVSVLAAYLVGNAVVSSAFARLVVVSLAALSTYYCVLKACSPRMIDIFETKLRSRLSVQRLGRMQLETEATAGPRHANE